MGMQIEQLTGQDKPDKETVEQYRVILGAKEVKVEKDKDGIYTATAVFED